MRFAWVLMAGGTLGVACASREPAADPPPPRGAEAPAAVFGVSPCGECVKQECGFAQAACSREPTCARWMECHDACPNLASGSIDFACAARCPPPVESAALAARSSLLACMARSAPSPCVSCGVHPSAGSAAAVLAQKCNKTGLLPDTCDRCEAERCCETSVACDFDPNCRLLEECERDCVDSACKSKCFETYPESIARWGRHDACMISRCSEEDTCDYAGGNPKILCWTRRCAVPYAECRSEPDCSRYEACEEPCANSDLACRRACHEQFPKGKLLYETYFACIALRCLY
jgi:hypothetical protein